MPVKSMLHPTLASDIQRRRPSIENNAAGFISWERLTEAMRDSGNLTPREEIEAFVVTDDGLQFYVKRR